MALLGRTDKHYIVIPSMGLAYGRVPKVANSTIKRVLAEAAGIKGLFPPRGFSKDGNWRGKEPAAYFVSASVLRRKWPEIFVFSFVREPLSRLASCYRSKIAEPERMLPALRREGLTPQTSFAAFVAHAAGRPDRRCNIHYRPQSAIIAPRGKPIADFVGRYERFGEDWETLRAEAKARSGASLPPAPRRSAKRAVTDVDEYFRGDEALIAMARRRYAEDYRLFYPELM